MGGASERAPSSPSGLGFYSPDTHVLPCRGAGCRGVDYGSSATVCPHGAHDQMQPSGLRAQPTSPDLDNRMPQCLPSALLLPEDERHACACVCAHVVTHACVRACVRLLLCGPQSHLGRCLCTDGPIRSPFVAPSPPPQLCPATCPWNVEPQCQISLNGRV